MTEKSGLSSPILPGGTVTFLFTDIEGSTQLLGKLKDQYATLLAGHHQIIREALEKWNGREVDTQGDAFFAAFPKATEAVAAVAQIQRALAGHSWPEGAEVRVRMGLHTGEPWLVEEGYVGMDVHRAARIGHVGYGGQVLLSETTTALVQDELPEGVTLLELGRHRLKDMRRPEPIQQLVLEGLPAEFPPLKSLEALPAAHIGPPSDGKAGAPREVGPSPYRGLAAFQETDAELFFGREGFIDQLALAVGEQQLVAVIIGPSGAGKSSAVFAGLLPQLREEGNWLIVEMRPGARPFHALAAAVIPALEDELTKTDRLIETQKLAQALRDGELSLFQVADLALTQRADADRLLLVIDQFEEIFTLRPDPEDQQLFLDELLAAASAAASHRRAPLVLLLTLRADFMGQALGHRPFTDALQEGALILGPMNREELQTAVEKPAELAGAAFEPGLVPRILDDIGEEPGNLPLLEFALTLLWDRLEDGWMTHAAYDEIGRVDGALARYAEEVWEELDEAEREGARSLFVQLVQPGEGTEDTRRVARRTELAPGHWTLVQHLADRRLVVTGQDEAGDETVEVVHEALIRGWERLRSWMMVDRAFRTWQESLRAAQRGWESSGRDEGSLLRAAPLALALEWAEEQQAELSASELEFIESSRQRSEKRATEEAARRQRELETAQRLAEAEHARAEEQEKAASGLRRRAYFLGGVLVAAVLLAIAAIFFAQQSSSNAAVAEQNADIAATSEAEAVTEAGQRATAQAEALVQAEEAQKSANLAATAEANAEEERALAQESEAAAIAAQEEAVAAQAEAVAQAEIARFNEAQAHSLALTSGAREAFSGGDVDLALALAVQAVSVEQPPTEAVRTLNDVAYAPGTRLIYENEDQDSYMDLVEMLPGDSHLISQDSGHTLTVWDPNSGEILNQFDTANEDATFRRLENIPDSTYIATAYNNNELIIWDWATGEKVQTLPDIDMTYVGRLFGAPGGDIVITTIYQGVSETEVDGVPEGFSLTGWDIESGEQVYRIDGEPGERFTWNMATPDREMALIATSVLDEEYHLTGESRLLMIDLKTGEILSEPTLAELNGNNFIESISINPESDQAFAILTDIDDQGFETAADPSGRTAGSIGVFFSLPAGEVVKTVEFDTDVSFSKYSPDGRQIVVMIPDPSQRYFALLDAMSGEQLVQLGSRSDGHDGDVNDSGAIAFTPDGKRLVSSSSGGDVLLWDLETGEIIQRLFGHAGQSLFSVAISPDGETAISNGTGGVGNLRFWDIRQDVTARVFEEHMTDIVIDVAISPDGTKAISTAFFSPDESGNEAILWDTETFEVIHRLPGFFADAEFLPDGKSAILGGNATGNDVENPQLLLVHWDLESGAELKRKESTEISEAFAIALSPDSSSLLLGARDLMQQFDIETFTEMTSFPANEFEWLQSVAFIPDGKTAIAGGDLGDLILYDLDTGEEIRRYNRGGGTRGLDISADGERFVSSGANHTAILWDIASGEAIQTFNGHTNGVYGVAFTPDESQIVTGSADGTLILWDVSTGDALRTFSEHGVFVNQVALSPDGQLAYSASDDGTVIVRPVAELPVEDILAYIADNRVLRDFTCVERKQYRILPLCDADSLVPDSGD
jgi:WD40 repeat protein/class 3 adenylate cyclase